MHTIKLSDTPLAQPGFAVLQQKTKRLIAPKPECQQETRTPPTTP